MDKPVKEKSIVAGVCASIACYKACDIVSGLVQKGMDVVPVLTPACTNLIAPLTFQYLSGNRCYTKMFNEGNFSPEHIALSDRADLIIVAPATACTIGKLAAGITDNLLTCLIAAARVPVLIAPAMNTRMYEHPVTTENIAKLTKLGYHFIGPESGWLSCGTAGKGRMSSPEDIIRQALTLLK